MIFTLTQSVPARMAARLRIPLPKCRKIRHNCRPVGLLTAFPSEGQKQMRKVRLILLPVTCEPHPATGTTDPMAFHPNSRRSWTRDPCAGDPHVLRSGPTPITGCPNIPRTWRDGLRLDANRRRSLSYQDLSRGWTRRCYFSRGGCRRHRRWFLSAADQCTCRQDQ